MPSKEYHQKDPAKDLEEALVACQWSRAVSRTDTKGLWEKGRSRLYVDEIGVFLYRLLGDCWVRTAGLSHNRIKVLHLRERVIRFDDFEIDLITGN